MVPSLSKKIAFFVIFLGNKLWLFFKLSGDPMSKKKPLCKIGITFLFSIWVLIISFSKEQNFLGITLKIFLLNLYIPALKYFPFFEILIWELLILRLLSLSLLTFVLFFFNKHWWLIYTNFFFYNHRIVDIYESITIYNYKFFSNSFNYFVDTSTSA